MFANATFKVGISQRVVATLVACAVLLMSVGLYTTAQAANLTNVKDTHSDSDGAVASNHTIQFVSPTGVANTGTIVIDFSDGPFVNPGSAVDFTDIDVATTSDLTLAAACGGATDVSAVFSAGPVLTLTLCAGGGESIPANGTTTIEIGKNATGGGANTQLVNPAAGQSYEIVITAGASDSGRTRVAIIDDVLVTAVVDTTFDFVIEGLATSTAIDSATTTGVTSATVIDYGQLTAGVPEILGQRLNVTSNAINGFVVTVETDGAFMSANGADIDNFTMGSDEAAPIPWADPVSNISDEDTWGHWGVTTEDDLPGWDPGDYMAASTSFRTVFSHNGPSDGSTVNQGETDVAYKVYITPLQEAADDYSTILTYIATPTF